jgi:hypothetical protein
MKKITNKQIKDVAKLHIATTFALDNGFDYEKECNISERDRQRIRIEISNIGASMIKNMDIKMYPTCTQGVIDVVLNK